MKRAKVAPGVDIVYQDAHIVVVNKPSGLPTTSTRDEDCLRARLWRLDYDAELIHATSRLDQPVTGLVTFARSKFGTTFLEDARLEGRYGRSYLGIAAVAPKPAQGRWRASIQNQRNPGPELAAETRYKTAITTSKAALIVMSPLTGRTHQLRIHAQIAGCPFLGDRAHGGATRLSLDQGRLHAVRRVMLHCVALELPNPDGGSSLKLNAPPPDDFEACWTAVGGEIEALKTYGTP